MDLMHRQNQIHNLAFVKIIINVFHHTIIDFNHRITVNRFHLLVFFELRFINYAISKIFTILINDAITIPSSDIPTSRIRRIIVLIIFRSVIPRQLTMLISSNFIVFFIIFPFTFFALIKAIAFTYIFNFSQSIWIFHTHEAEV